MTLFWPYNIDVGWQISSTVYIVIYIFVFLRVYLERIVPHLLQGSVGVGAHAIQFVDECEEGDIIALHLPVNRHGLTLDSSHRAQHQHSSVQHPQRSLHLNGKVHVSWRIEEDSDI